MGGITLNVFVAALFYDKVEKHMKRVPKEQKEEPEPSQAKFSISQEGSIPSLQHIPHDTFLEHIETSEGNFNRSASSAAVQHMKSQQSRERKISMPMGKQEVMKARNMSSNSTLHAVPEKLNGNQSMDIMAGHTRMSTRRRTGGKLKVK